MLKLESKECRSLPLVVLVLLLQALEVLHEVNKNVPNTLYIDVI